ncbi:MAG: vWA domain-containing protein [Hyphomicrobiaceae bacterium]
MIDDISRGTVPHSVSAPDTHVTSIGDNILHFGRLLRAAGLPVGTGQIIDAARAVAAVGLTDKTRLYWALHAALVKRRSERALFDQAFAIFWRDPGFLSRMMSLMIPQTSAPRTDDQEALSRRLSDALAASQSAPRPEMPELLDVDAFETFSDQQTDRSKDFAQMSGEELRAAQGEIQKIRLLRLDVLTRRYESAEVGARVDLRRMLKDGATKGPDHLLLRWRRRRRRRPPLVILCDISGSMDSYARVFLHFLYALKSDRDRVSCFLFATRLHNVTRKLENRDPDAAIAAVGSDVTDWSGGTRIGQCITMFNRTWARRVLGQNAHVLLFTDGLDREGGEGMERAIRRLAASCQKLVWVNPLLRYDRYEPIAAGARILNRYASETRSCHSINSLAELARALNTQS